MRIESLLMNMDNSISSRSKIAGILAQDPEYLNECIEFIVQHNDDFSLKCLMAIEMLSRNRFPISETLFFTIDSFRKIIF